MTERANDKSYESNIARTKKRRMIKNNAIYKERMTKGPNDKKGE